MKYILVKTKTNKKDVKEDKYFKGYPGKDCGKGVGNKPTWTDDPSEAAEYDAESLAIGMRRRLALQSQIVELVPVEGSESEFQKRLRKFGNQ